METGVSKKRRKWASVISMLLMVFAFVPTEACACIQTSHVSSFRILLALSLGLLFGVALIISPKSRLAWAAMAVLVAVLSCIAAVSVVLGEHSVVASLTALLFGPAVFIGIVWGRAREHSTKADRAV